MLTSISPLGERARHNRWSWTVGWYVVASVAAGAAVGVILGLVGALLAAVGVPAGARAVGWAGLALVAVAVDLGRLPLPTWRRQVDEDWLNRYRGWVYGSAFGAQLGAGVVTIVTTAAVYLTLAAEVAAGTIAGGVIIGVVFGAARATPILTLARTSSFDQLSGRHRRLVALAAPARRATVAAMSLGVLVVVLLAVR